MYSVLLGLTETANEGGEEDATIEPIGGGEEVLIGLVERAEEGRMNEEAEAAEAATEGVYTLLTISSLLLTVG